MKKDTHPEYFAGATITCACGNTMKAGSTADKLEIEVCSACHPFYTGDAGKKVAAGRVERFKARSAAAKAKADKSAAAKKKQTGK